MVCLATLCFSSCSIFGGTSSNSVAQASGMACGTAVLGLYQSYHSTGKLDLSSGSNLTNALALATAYTALQQNKSDESYKKSFTNGLIASSAGLITNSNANTFINTLLGTTALNNATAQTITQTANTTASVISLLNTLNSSK